MGIIQQLFTWIKVKDKHEKEINVGYILQDEPKTLEEIAHVFHAFKLDKYYSQIEPLVRTRIDLTLESVDEADLEKEKSKIGGQPSLALNQTWPNNELSEPLSFIAQINLAEIVEFDTQNLFPKTGLLSFFYCAEQQSWGFDPKNNQRFKVLYTEDLSTLKNHDFPEDLNEESIFNPSSISFSTSLSIPTLEDDCIIHLIADEDQENYMDVSMRSDNQIFGYANCIQQSMELECELVTNGIYCGDGSGYSEPNRKTYESGAKDWILLLQIDSDEDNTGMMWGDCGRLYFWIRKQDLVEKQFDKAWCILQCG